MKKQTKMNTKNLLVFFVTLASILLLATSVSAANIGQITDVKVDGIVATYCTDDTSLCPVLTAGETITIKVYFNALESDKDVTVKVTLDTGKEKAEAETSSFRVNKDGSYIKTLTLEVPNELKDDLSDEATLEIEIEGADHELDEFEELSFIVERTQYDSTFKSVDVPTSVSAGETFPVDFVVKNTGYYDLEDVYVTVSVPALGIEKNVYLDELYALDGERTYETIVDGNVIETTVIGDEDNEDTLSGRVMLTVPYNVAEGIYAIELHASNDDTSAGIVGQIEIKNDFAESVVQNGNDLIIVNPTDKVKMYRVVAESPGIASESVVVVQAGSSKTVTISTDADGTYEFSVNVFDGNDLVSTTVFSGEASTDDQAVSSPIVVLTVVLIIVFVILLIVLVVLITKKPEKAEDFGESYY